MGVGASMAGTVIGFFEGFIKGIAAPVEGLNIGALAAGIVLGMASEKQMGDIQTLITGCAAACMGIGLEGLISGFMPKPAET